MYKKIALLLIISLITFIITSCADSALPAQTTAVATPESIMQTAAAMNIPLIVEPATSTEGADPSFDENGNERDPAITYPVLDTGQSACYDASEAAAACPAEGEALFGQDAQFSGSTPSYTDNDDGTITDNVTGLMWQQSPDTNGDGMINATDKLTYAEAVAGASMLTLGGYTDWRLPTIKELYSLILFDGTDPSGNEDADTSVLIPFIDNAYFDFAYGDTSSGERIIDAQYATSTKYVATTMNGDETMFGVNFADGRIKGYGLSLRGREKSFFVIYVRGNPDYGIHDIVDNGDGTIMDQATDLMWVQSDSGAGMDWQKALAYCQYAATAGYDDWRLPNAKELQSIVDYTRSPDTTNSAAIDPLFNVTPITNEAGEGDYPAYWSSTTHANFRNGRNAAYVNFGRSMGYMHGNWLDVHGAGAQRSDPKSGDPTNWPTGHGPQGDAIRIYNYVRCTRGGEVTVTPDGGPDAARPAMMVESTGVQQDPAGGMPGNTPGQGVMPSGGGPPLEAIDACTGLSQENSCQFITPNSAVSGACAFVQGQLACVPTGSPLPAQQP